jgi:hypothetical protein
MAIAALVVIGIILVVLGLFLAGSLPLIVIGVVALIAAAGYEVIGARRT